jgi:hypothetical protein
MVRPAGSVAIVLLVVLAGGGAEGGAGNADPAAVRLEAPSVSYSPGPGVPTASVLDCLMGCASQVTDCGASCTNKPLGDAANCGLACIEADIKCVTGCGPALRPAPPANV